MRGKLGSSLTGYFRDNLGLVILVSFFFILGIVGGTLSLQLLSGNQEQTLVEYLASLLNNLQDQAIDSQLLAVRSIFNNLIVILAIWFLGLTVIGIPVIVGIVFSRAFVFGFTVGFLVEKMGWQGISFACLSILPQSLLFVPTLVMAGVAAVSFSLHLVGGGRRNPPGSLYKKVLKYCLYMLILCGIAVVAALVEAYITPVFMKLLAAW